MRPTLEEIADARAEATRMLLGRVHSDPLSVLRVLVAATAPLTKEDAIPVMVANLNAVGEWPSYEDDIERARDALNSPYTGSWGNAIRAQWATLRHFMGGAE